MGMFDMWAAVVLLWSVRSHDVFGHHFAPIELEGAVAISEECTGFHPWSSCVSTLLAVGSLESGYNPKASHDNHRGCGAFGVLCTYPHATWREQVRSAWSIILKSAATCPEPLELYAAGRCGVERAKRISRARMELAEEIGR